MTPQASSSKEAGTQPPPQPPTELARDLQRSKVIFFTLDTLFDRDHATECALERCRELNQDLRSKSMDELKRAYDHAMAAAYRQHIIAHLRGSGPGGSHILQASVDKVAIFFQQLNLNLPSERDRSLIGNEFAAEFSRNKFEVHGVSKSLAQLQKLEYAIVVADDDLDWKVVKDLNFWQYIDANIITNDPLVRKPDPRVFKNALDACGVSPSNAVIVGSSIEKDIHGIIAAGAEPILYMPGHNNTVMDVQGTRVLVVRTMVELLVEMQRRPENSHLVRAQRRQLPPIPPFPSHPSMINAPQNQAYPDNQNGEPSAQHHYQGSSQSRHPAPGPQPVEDRHASQSWESTRPSQPGSSNETPRTHMLSSRGQPTKYYERTVRPAPSLSSAPAKRSYYQVESEHGYLPSSRRRDHGYPHDDSASGHYDPAGKPSPGPSTKSSSTHAPHPVTPPMRPISDGSGGFGTRSSSPVNTPQTPPPPPTLPPISPYPLTEDYGISKATYVENWDQPRSQYEGYGNGTSRNR
ncbi:hypothetical protein FMUND_7098 [Fusarium mundagurra]|uniref:Uncharacterized protein n=1 Tax=Fusarium mundagurra TaxID=1567541 RepID=A0A8H6DFJ8_9HYPO|nr:hypothetical protein FMUND_7098 [Fusarium mundagurra]